jgi:hypothetical protein
MTALLEAVRVADPGIDIAPIERAYMVAAQAHNGQLRKSGDPYITHPITVATIVAEIGMGTEAICAALLHDTVEDTDYSLDFLRKDFGEVVADLVEGVTELDKIRSCDVADLATMRDVVLEIAPDPRVLVIKLADRLHNMRTMRFLPPQRQARKAKETLEVFAPLAHQLGMVTVKRELEDLATGILYPEPYDRRRRTVAERALAVSVLLLPAAQRVRWAEEWAGELSVLPTRRARARFAIQMLRGMPRFAVIVRRPGGHHTHRLARTILEKITGALSVSGAFLAAVIRWELPGWMVVVMVVGGLVLLGTVLFARSDEPANRLRGLVRAWRSPVSTPSFSRRQRRGRLGRR